MFEVDYVRNAIRHRDVVWYTLRRYRNIWLVNIVSVVMTRLLRDFIVDPSW